MGANFDNIHLRCENRPLIEQAWQQYWTGREAASWAWVSPVYHGWISVFDWRCDQQDASVLRDLTAHLSRVGACAALAFQLQDSDVAEYWLYQAGRELDHYTSDTSYVTAFESYPSMAPDEGVFDGYGPAIASGAPMREDQSGGGDITRLRAVTGIDASAIELEAILRTPAVVADDILATLASTLGMHESWASLGYHYLVTEGEMVPQFEAFHHLPLNTTPNIAQNRPDH